MSYFILWIIQVLTILWNLVISWLVIFLLSPGFPSGDTPVHVEVTAQITAVSAAVTLENKRGRVKVGQINKILYENHYRSSDILALWGLCWWAISFDLRLNIKYLLWGIWQVRKTHDLHLIDCWLLHNIEDSIKAGRLGNGNEVVYLLGAGTKVGHALARAALIVGLTLSSERG